MTHFSDPDLALFHLARQAQRNAERCHRRRKNQIQQKSVAFGASSDSGRNAVKRSARQARGDEYEARASAFLRKANLIILEHQLHSPFGEIDLIARDEVNLIFIEVRSRSSGLYGGAAASVTPAKQRKMILTAQWWLPALTRRYFNGILPPCRFDVIAFEATRVFWCKDAVRIRQDK